MISKNINNGSHGLFPSAAAAGSFLVIHLVSGLFVPDFALIRGVHKLNEMVLTLMERLALSAKPGVFNFFEGSFQWSSRRGWYLLQFDALDLP